MFPLLYPSRSSVTIVNPACLILSTISSLFGSVAILLIKPGRHSILAMLPCIRTLVPGYPKLKSTSSAFSIILNILSVISVSWGIRVSRQLMEGLDQRERFTFWASFRISCLVSPASARGLITFSSCMAFMPGRYSFIGVGTINYVFVPVLPRELNDMPK